MEGMDEPTRMMLFGDLEVSEPVLRYLLYDEERCTENSRWLESSVAMEKVVEKAESISGEELVPVRVERTSLLMCEYDSDEYCLGRMTNGRNPLATFISEGGVLDTRFAMLSVRGKYNMRVYASVAYESGRISLSTMQGQMNENSMRWFSIRCVLFHKNAPWRVEEIMKASDVDANHCYGPIDFVHEAKLDGTCWERFRAVAPALSRTWGRMQLEIAHAMGMKMTESTYQVILSHRLVVDGPELCELRREFVNKLFDRALFGSLSSPDTSPEVLALPSTEELTSSESADPLGIDDSLTCPAESGLDDAGNENVCPECGHVFKRVYELRRHIDSVHLRIRNYPCEICGKRFSQSGHVRVHIQTVHEKAALHFCEICGRGFGTKPKLVRHRRSVHEKSRHYECRICNSKYFQSSDLKRHVRTKHKIY
eukprot:CAMPEP_0113964610 /NCGR_PEP_ID=MMETSP0011_2-20120614/7250_1 /TAXON_ID=101924 /ORGANISM="Rhodosorus marinus" /LENGTH=424 /DNA_ID=CAMNT_0000976961 /DNA_START=92 /DNA_END=1366 /DNA_ORIENTATION=- /assembly_acc=CAM_ASM_000156